MKRLLIAALAAAPAATLFAQAPAAPAPDYSAAIPIGGNWTYKTTTDGSEAAFVGASSQSQIVFHCARALRRVTIAKPAAGAAPFLTIWTSSDSRTAPTSFNPATNRLTADFAAYDRILDAIAFSRGRVAFKVGSAPALIVPPWSEISRVIEDCRT